jgi:hypothetical protein
MGVRPDAPTIETIEFVIPAKARIQLFQDVLDPGFRRGDAPRDFLRDHQLWVETYTLWQAMSNTPFRK